MYASATVTGQLGQDPKYFTTQTGTRIMSFGIPVKNTNKETAWIQVKAFGKCVDFYEGKLQKGTSVSASGRLTPMFYTAKDGERKSGWELNLQPYCLQFPWQEQSQQQPAPQQQQQQQAPQQQQQQAPQQQRQQQAPQQRSPAPHQEQPIRQQAVAYSSPNLDEIPF